MKKNTSLLYFMLIGIILILPQCQTGSKQDESQVGQSDSLSAQDLNSEALEVENGVMVERPKPRSLQNLPLKKEASLPYVLDSIKMVHLLENSGESILASEVQMLSRNFTNHKLSDWDQSYIRSFVNFDSSLVANNISGNSMQGEYGGTMTQFASLLDWIKISHNRKIILWSVNSSLTDIDPFGESSIYYGTFVEGNQVAACLVLAKTEVSGDPPMFAESWLHSQVSSDSIIWKSKNTTEDEESSETSYGNHSMSLEVIFNKRQ